MMRDRYDSRVRGRVAEIAAELGWPAWVVKKRAAFLGITRAVDRQDWTHQEEAILMEFAGKRSAEWIARRLKRSLTSVVLKFKRMGISRRVRGGYTMRDLERCFGVDHRVITGWMRRGWLRERRRDEKGDTPERRSMCVTEADVVAFIAGHPMAFRLDRVEQEWFMRLLLAARRRHIEQDRCPCPDPPLRVSAGCRTHGLASVGP